MEKYLVSQKERDNYKDSEDAFFEKEKGDEEELVVVQDHFTNGTTIEFSWYRGKSNNNIGATGIGKEGFSFYFARYAYRDPYLMKRQDLPTKKDGRIAILGKLDQEDEDIMLIIQAEDRGNGKVHIISATYETRKRIKLDYYERFYQIQKREKEIKNHLTESTGNKAIKEAIIERRKRLSETLQDPPNFGDTSIQKGTTITFRVNDGKERKWTGEVSGILNNHGKLVYSVEYAVSDNDEKGNFSWISEDDVISIV